MGNPSLHVLFTMDCPPAGARAEPRGPQSWELGARAMDAFCTCLLDAGYAPTLFLTPEAAGEHDPMCDELAGAGVELALLVHPPALRGAGYKRYLGAYPREQQQEIVAEARRRFEDALGRRPQSVRSAMFSASDATFAVLWELGFRQSSLSSPGRQVRRHAAVWTDAAPDVHFVSATNRLVAGSLPLVEVPVTTDATQRRGGVAPDLAIENGTLERWHRPLIAGQLARQASQGVRFRALCFVTSSRVAYHDRSSRFRQTLEALLDHLEELGQEYEIVPVTLAGVAARLHRAD